MYFSSLCMYPKAESRNQAQFVPQIELAKWKQRETVLVMTSLNSDIVVSPSIGHSFCFLVSTNSILKTISIGSKQWGVWTSFPTHPIWTVLVHEFNHRVIKAGDPWWAEDTLYIVVECLENFLNYVRLIIIDWRQNWRSTRTVETGENELSTYTCCTEGSSSSNSIITCFLYPRITGRILISLAIFWSHRLLY